MADLRRCQFVEKINYIKQITGHFELMYLVLNFSKLTLVIMPSMYDT